MIDLQAYDYKNWRPGREELIPAQLLERERDMAEAPAYYVREGDGWKMTNFANHVAEIRKVANGLIALGINPDDKIAIIGFNRPEWVIMAYAAMMVRAVPVGIYTTSSAPEVAYILNHTEAKLLLFEDHDQYNKINNIDEALPHLNHMVMMRGEAVPNDKVLAFDDIAGKASEDNNAELEKRIADIDPKDLATLIYTSGTTGRPKGVMLSHQTVAWTVLALCSQSNVEHGQETVLSYLPLSHIAEQVTTLYMAPMLGSAIYFARSMDTVAEDLALAHPTFFFGVPRVWERVYAVLNGRMAEATGVKAKLLAWARKTASAYHEKEMNKQPIGGWLSFQFKLAHKLVFSKVHQAMGLDKAKNISSGAAPLSPEIIRFFFSLNICLREVYGQSEDCGPATVNIPGKTRIGSVGPAMTGLDIKIAEDGEILVKGGSLFDGYYKDEAATNETMHDGWLCSGDIGHIDEDGFVWITGRKKDIIITAGGKNIAPRPIEEKMEQHPFIEQAFLIGDQRQFVSLLITPNMETISAHCQEHGIKADILCHAPEILAEVEKHILLVNEDLARVMQPRKFTMLKEPFSLENGEMTPTLKIKRNVVIERHAQHIEQMYNG